MRKLITWFGFNAFPENIPQRKAGIYLIENLSNGMKYVGISHNVAKRVRQHLGSRSRKYKLGAALHAEGASQFLVIPLFYSTTGTEHLEITEALLIKEYDSISRGYNIAAAGRSAGPYGPAFSARLTVALNKPETKAKKKKTMADPEWRRKHSDTLRAAYQRPEVMEFWRAQQNPPDPVENGRKISASFKRPEIKMKLRARRRPVFTEEVRKTISTRVSEFKNTDAEKKRTSGQMLALFADDTFKKKHLESSREANARPERRAKIKAYRVGGQWITDDNTQRYLPSGEEIPAGWRRGMLKRSPKY